MESCPFQRLVIDGKVVSAGRQLSPEEAKKAIVGASA